jgi:hypothetical protein
MKWTLPAFALLAALSVVGNRWVWAAGDAPGVSLPRWEYGILSASPDSLQVNSWTTGKTSVTGFDINIASEGNHDFVALADLFRKMGGNPPPEGFGVLTVDDYLGSQGWELITTADVQGLGHTTVTRFTFKRAVK